MPNTVNRFFNVPNTGDLPGAWGTTAINANMNSLDGTLGGVGSIALSVATTITLSLPAGASFTPGTGPSQSENALIKFTGTLTGNAVIKFTMPGYYIVQNACGSAYSFSIQLSPASGTGTSIGAPPGKKANIFFDGTNVDYVDTPDVGSAMDLHQSGTALPVWMQACTVSPYLIKDGTVYNAASYTALAQCLGSTFGGNGSSTFGVPDERSRMRVAIDTGVTGRVTSGVSGITGTQMGSGGGDQLSQQHAHVVLITSQGQSADHTHSYNQPVVVYGGTGGGLAIFGPSGTSTGGTSNDHTHLVSGNTNNSGGGLSQNMPPCIVDFLALIKT